MNRRLLLTLLATAALTGPLGGAGVAVAADQPRAQAQRGGDRGGPDRGGPNRNRERGDQGSRGSQGPRGQWRDERAPAMRREDDGERGAMRAAPRSDYGPPPGYGGYERPRSSYGVRRGGYLPPQAPGYVVEDYGRYRLRPPPRGYDWVRVGDDFLLVAPDGQIFDMIRP
ncbi:MAG: RcnB family protein [Phenylobacterium sp.]